jgi:uncharacterized protein YcbK (DUF882 family)
MTFDLSKTIVGTRSFSWKEALYCPKWQIYVFPSEQEQSEIIKIAYKLQQIRDYFGMPITITSWLRPKLYNELIKGSVNSLHIKGMAVDFVVEGVNCDEVRNHLVSRLDDLKIRMENKPNANWVHIDHGIVGKTGRYFNP